MISQAWSQQQEPVSNANSQALTPVLLNQKLREEVFVGGGSWSPAICILKSLPDDSDARSSLMSTVLSELRSANEVCKAIPQPHPALPPLISVPSTHLSP